jgi:hypothetical protein
MMPLSDADPSCLSVLSHALTVLTVLTVLLSPYSRCAFGCALPVLCSRCAALTVLSHRTLAVILTLHEQVWG